MRIALINRFYPPDGAITGRSLDEFARFLAQVLPEAEINVFCSEASYKSKNVAKGGHDVSVNRISFAKIPIPGNVGRLLTSMIEGRKLARAAVEWADVLISMTDPPLLGFWVAREIERKGKRAPAWIEWTMDLYPEAFVAAGLAGAKNPIVKYISQKLTDINPDAFICLGPEQAEYVAERRKSSAPTFILPCGIVERSEFEGEEIPAWKRGEDRIILIYAGNIGQAHCVDFLPSLVQMSDPETHVFVMALYGAHAEETKQRIGGAKNVKYVDYVSYSEAIHADIHLASLEPHWNHICVPSKAVSSICLEKPILYAGDDKSDNYALLGNAMWRVSPETDRSSYNSRIAAVLSETQTRDAILRKSDQATKIASEFKRDRDEVLAAIADWVSTLSSNNSRKPSGTESIA